VLVQTVVTLINLGGQKLGLTEDTKEASDPDQTRVAIEAVRALLPLIETDEQAAAHVRPVRDALARLQMAYAQRAGTAAGQPQAEPPAESKTDPQEQTPPTEPPKPRPTGGLWVPPGTKT
jgi:hypothetical protein